MESKDNYYLKGKRKSFWSVIGYLAFGILGIIIGAALVYGIFILYFVQDTSDTIVVDEAEELVEEAPVLVIEQALTDIIKKVMPAVVAVNSHSYNQRFGRQVEEVGSGSGVVISRDGYILTNQHVVENGDRITVIIQDHGLYEAELIGSDDLTDLALLKINETDLTYIEFGDSAEAMVGEYVIAIGNPLGYFQQTVTAGIISAVDRQVRIPGSYYVYTYIQTDALINPGNSGGPLLSMNGKIVGINTAKVAVTGVEGIGLAIPSNTAQRVALDLIDYGRVIRPHLGVLIEDWLDYGIEKPDRGVLIADVVSESPAEKAGLVPGDIIVAIDNINVFSVAQLFDRLFAYYPGDSVKVSFYRNGERSYALLILGERPEGIGQSFAEDNNDVTNGNQDGDVSEEGDDTNSSD